MEDIQSILSPFSKRLAKTTRHAQKDVKRKLKIGDDKDTKKSKLQTESNLETFLKENNAPAKTTDQSLLKNAKEVKFIKKLSRKKKETSVEKLASKKALDYGRRLRGERSLFPTNSEVKNIPAEDSSFFDKAHNPFLADSCAERSRHSLFSGIKVSEEKFEALENRINRKGGLSQKEVDASNAAKKLANSKRVLVTDTIVGDKRKNKVCIEESPLRD